MRYVIDLRSRDALRTEKAGGKGAGLAWLARQGYDVPAGFVITTDACRDFLAALDPQKEQDKPQESCLLTAPLPRGVGAAIADAYRELGGTVAVRSSMVGEDGGASSYAGQFETCLNINGPDQVLAAVRACWASALSPRAAAYSSRGEAGGTGPEMAVVVQRMVVGRAGGVAFSADPLSGEDRVVIEAAGGSGQGVVAGTAAPDRYVVDERGVLAEYLPLTPHGGHLTEEQALQLAGLVRNVQERAESPRDVEWVWDGTAFRLLQCRPITGLAGRRIYSRRLVADMAPGLVKPMVFSTNTRAVVREVFGKIFVELAGANLHECEQLVVNIHSRVYADMTMFGELLGRAGLPPNMMEMMLRDEKPHRRRRMRMSAAPMVPMARLAWLVIRHARLPRNHARRAAEREAELEQFRDRAWGEMPAGEMLAALDELLAIRDSHYFEFFASVMRMAGHTQLLRRWLARRAPELQVSDVTAGLVGLRSLEPSREIRQLGLRAAALGEETWQRLLSGSLNEIETTLRETPADRELAAGFDALIGEYGYLSSNGSDFTARTWREDRLPIWRAVGRAAGAGPGEERNPLEVRIEAEKRVRQQVGALQEAIFRRLCKAATRAIEDREAVSLLMSQFSYEIRRLYLALGEALARSNAVVQAEDLFYLTYPELHALVQGGLAGDDAAGLISARRAKAAADELIDVPDVTCEKELQPEGLATHAPPAAAVGKEYLTGIRGSGGTVRGRARIVRDPGEAPETLSREDILVVPFSDVGWTPLFSGIGGIVVETGGQLSHAAIVAREYGLPSVLSVTAATRLIREGQHLVLDGGCGRVYLGAESTE